MLCSVGGTTTLDREWWIYPLLRGHLFYKIIFCLSQRWPLNTGITVHHCFYIYIFIYSLYYHESSQKGSNGHIFTLVILLLDCFLSNHTSWVHQNFSANSSCFFLYYRLYLVLVHLSLLHQWHSYPNVLYQHIKVHRMHSVSNYSVLMRDMKWGMYYLTYFYISEICCSLSFFMFCQSNTDFEFYSI